MSHALVIINTPSKLGRHSSACQVSHGCTLNFVLVVVINTPSQLGRYPSPSSFGKDVCNLLMCRKVLHVYYFPLHHVSNIIIFYLNVFLSIMKHRVLKDIYTQLWLSSSNPSHDQVNMSEACEATLLRTLNAIYYVSVVLKATELYFLLHQETMENFKVKQQSNVLF